MADGSNKEDKMYTPAINSTLLKTDPHEGLKTDSLILKNNGPGTPKTNGLGTVNAIPTTNTGLIYDPYQKVYPKEDIGTLPGANNYIDPNQATVEGRVTGLLGKDNLLNKRTQALSNQAGNNRGLLNSRGNVEAGTAALIDKATEIAKPDAQTYADFGKQNQQTTNQSIINNQASELERQNIDYSSKLTGSLNEQSSNLKNNEAAFNAKLQEALNNQTFGQTKEGIQLQADLSKAYKEFSFGFDKQLEQMGYDEKAKSDIANIVSSQTSTLINNMGQLLNNTDIVLNENVPTWMTDYIYQSWQTISSLYSVPITVV